MVERSIRSGKRPERRAEWEAELAGEPMPLELAYLWKAFWRIRRRKGGNGFGVSPIEWPDIDAFIRNSRFYLAPWEIRVIEDIDDVYVDVHSEAAREKTGRGKE